ncbi:MAG: hypothetical protein HY053_02165 [Proteobacteria bacterium]|nr:hypothetical protein [Pseudomonadota bacterium]
MRNLPVAGMFIRGDFLPLGQLFSFEFPNPPPPRPWLIAAPFERTKHLVNAAGILFGYPVLGAVMGAVEGGNPEKLKRWSRKILLASTVLGMAAWAGLTLADILTTGGTGTLIATALGGGKIAAFLAAAAETTHGATASVAAYLGAGKTAMIGVGTVAEVTAAGVAAGLTGHLTTQVVGRTLAAGWGLVKGTGWGLATGGRMLWKTVPFVTPTRNLFATRAKHRDTFIKTFQP